MDSQQQSIRARFAMPDGIYMLNHSVGCLPLRSRQAALDCMELWAQQGGEAWYGWLDYISAFRDNLAQLLGTRRELICPQTNVSSALTKLIGALPRPAGRTKIVLTEMDFPTIGYVCEKAKPEGVEVVYIPDVNGTIPLELWDQYLGEDCWFTVATHAYSNNSFLAPMAGIQRIAGSRGIVCVADIAQSAGAVPIDLAAWQSDVAIGSSVKWLCGGSGACFMFIDEKLLPSLQPRDVGWFSAAEPFNYDIHRFEYAPDALRFWGGTPGVLTYAIAGTSIALISEIGMENIRAHNQRLTARLIEAAQERGHRVGTPLEPEMRGGTVAIDFGDNAAALERMKQRGIKVDQRPRFGLRFSPHIYNSAGEIEDVIKAF